MMPKFGLLITLLALGLLAGGCGKKANKRPLGYNVKVQITADRLVGGMVRPPLEIHVFALNIGNAKRFNEIDMAEYWDPAHPGLRPRHYHTLRFVESTDRLTLRADDPIWAAMEADQEAPVRDLWMFVVADHKGELVESRPGRLDERRETWSLDYDKWENAVDIQVKIGRRSIVTTSTYVKN